MDTKMNENMGTQSPTSGSSKTGLTSGASIHTSQSPDGIGKRSNTGSTYRATIRTPMNSQPLNSGINASLTALEGDEHEEGSCVMTNLSHRARELAGTTRESLSSMKDSLVNRASHLGEQISDITGSTKESIVNRTHIMSNRVKNFDYGHVVDDTRIILSRDPLRTMIIAGGIGLALGFLIGRNRH